MSKRLTRALILLSMGGMTFSFGFLGAGCQQPFYGNAPGQGYAVAVGDNIIGDIAGRAFTEIKNYNIDNADVATLRNQVCGWVQVPLTNLWQNVWAGYVGSSIASDPTYGALLVQ